MFKIKKLYFIIVSVVLAGFFIPVLSACDWCDEVAMRKAMFMPEDKESAENSSTAKPVASFSTEKSDPKFYSEYLGKYYPNANYMCNNLFVNMCPKGLFKALDALAAIVDKKLWHYFLDNKKGFDCRYLTKILFELDRIDLFIDQAYYNTTTKKIVELAPRVMQQSSHKKDLQRLTKTWELALLGLPYDFYAICYDYSTVEFNSGVMCFFETQDSTSGDWSGRMAIEHAFGKMDAMIHKLAGSIYEKYYQDAWKRTLRIIDVLKNRIEASNPQRS